ncbi:hypothetical protein Q5P01_017783 [Channa striata]|uniref:Uncharacterized protein n=1 Tax=Channa striata TaxID=64152 RepID=A0AA88MBH4_CHASR|nr:hypothetical protein Q5P01_017783 [Channa striata]
MFPAAASSCSAPRKVESRRCLQVLLLDRSPLFCSASSGGTRSAVREPPETPRTENGLSWIHHSVANSGFVPGRADDI